MPLPEALREALRHDAAPVRPLLPPGARTALVLVVALLSAATLLTLAGLRLDRQMLDPWLLWIPASLRFVAGALLIYLALREGVPGSGGSTLVRSAALLGAPLLLVVLAEWAAAGGETAVASPPATIGLWVSLGCYPREVLVAVPSLLLFSWLLAQAYPLRPVFAATAGALGAALVADAVLHLACPMTALSHTLLVHGGAVASITAAATIGWLTGRVGLSR